MKKVFLIISLTLTTLQAGKYAGAFLENGVGARAMGMGGAYLSFTKDGTAFYWNPAGLAFIERPEINAMYSSQFGTFSDPLAGYNYIGGAYRLPNSGYVVALNWIRLNVSDIPVFPKLTLLPLPSDIQVFKPTEYFSDTEDAFFISVAKNFNYKLDLGWQYFTLPIQIPVGVNMKIIRQQLYHNKASGVGFDVGTQIRFQMNDLLGDTRFGEMAVGIGIDDITQTGIRWDTNSKREDAIPANFKWGIGYNQPLPRWQSEIIAAFSVEYRYKTRVRLGTEYEFRKLLALRIGADDGQFTAGFGARYWKIRLDYAFVSHELGNVHRISGAFSW